MASSVEHIQSIASRAYGKFRRECSKGKGSIKSVQQVPQRMFSTAAGTCAKDVITTQQTRH